jgi:hypothetical protein
LKVWIHDDAKPGGFCISRDISHYTPHRGATPEIRDMSEDTQPDHISKKRVLYTLPGMDAVTVRRDEPYRGADGGALTMDLYYPAGSEVGTRAPAVVFVTGFSDAGAEKMLGCTLKDMGSYVSWARLVAASGMIGITYTNRDPAADAGAVLQHVEQQGGSLGVDERRVGIWACSGNAPAALSLLMQGNAHDVKCAAFVCPYLLDGRGSSEVADAASRWRFVNPCAGQSVSDLRRDVPLLVARAGQDQMPGLNTALDRCMGEALACNLPITFVNHAAAPHAFDLFDDSETTRATIKLVLAFLRFHLR